MKKTHADVRSRIKKGEIGKDFRIIIVRLWSDGFEVKKIKGDSLFNNVQVFTLTVLPPGKNLSMQNTLSLAFTFKKTNHHEIFIHVIEEN